MTTSLIISTYNWKEALQLSLLSAFRQSRRPDEILVADDGSRDDTRELINRMAAMSPVPLYHVWHEDNGFRLSRIRNRATARAKGDYILSIDGDMVLHPHFVRDHIRVARTNYFTQGTRVLLGPEKSRSMLKDLDLSVTFWDHDIRNRKNALYLPWLARCFRGSKDSLRGVRGCNMAFWRQDLIRVNGFNEGFEGWGREDSELVVRLLNAGVRRQNLKFAGQGFHLYHQEATRDQLARNDDRLAEAIEQKSLRAELGLDQHL